MGAVAGATRRVTLPGELDRTIALTVADRRVVAHDQDVIALTLVGETTCRAGIPARTSTFTCPADWCGSTRCAAIPQRRTPTASPCGGSPTAAAARIEMHGLTVGATVTTHGPRNAFPLTVPGYGSPARRFRFIAGGIGITPILPMLRLAQRPRRRLVDGLRRPQPRQPAVRRRGEPVRRPGRRSGPTT